MPPLRSVASAMMRGISAFRPAAGVPPGGGSIVAEIGREQHGALEQVLDRRARHPQRKAAAEEWPTSVSGADGTVTRNTRGNREIVLELADIADIAARSRGAVAADIGSQMSRRRGWPAPCDIA